MAVGSEGLEVSQCSKAVSGSVADKAHIIEGALQNAHSDPGGVSCVCHRHSYTALDCCARAYPASILLAGTMPHAIAAAGEWKRKVYDLRTIDWFTVGTQPKRSLTKLKKRGNCVEWAGANLTTELSLIIESLSACAADGL